MSSEPQTERGTIVDQIHLIVAGDFSDFCVVSVWTSKELAEDEIKRMRESIPQAQGMSLRVDTHMLNTPVSESQVLWQSYTVGESD